MACEYAAVAAAKNGLSGVGGNKCGGGLANDPDGNGDEVGEDVGVLAGDGVLETAFCASAARLIFAFATAKKDKVLLC